MKEISQSSTHLEQPQQVDLVLADMFLHLVLKVFRPRDEPLQHLRGQLGDHVFILEGWEKQMGLGQQGTGDVVHITDFSKMPEPSHYQAAAAVSKAILHRQ